MVTVCSTYIKVQKLCTLPQRVFFKGFVDKLGRKHTDLSFILQRLVHVLLSANCISVYDDKINLFKGNLYIGLYDYSVLLNVNHIL